MEVDTKIKVRFLLLSLLVSLAFLSSAFTACLEMVVTRSFLHLLTNPLNNTNFSMSVKLDVYGEHFSGLPIRRLCCRDFLRGGGALRVHHAPHRVQLRAPHQVADAPRPP